jgi:DNA-binding transcriptional LysR family regulator
MYINQLRYILALCEEKNFSRAARRCGVSQPSLTNAVKALEDELGGTLFRRKPRPQMTSLGQTLLPYFLRVVEAVDQSVELAAHLVRQDADLTLAPDRLNGAGRALQEHRLAAGRPLPVVQLIGHDNQNRNGGAERHLP